MNKLNKTTIIGLLVFCVLLGVSITTWVSSGNKTDQVQASDSDAGEGESQSTNAPSDDDDLTPAGETATEMGVVYEDQGSEPIIQISEETLSKSKVSAPSLEDPDGLQIPTGFGISQEAQGAQAQESDITPNQNLQEMPVELETPAQASQPEGFSGGDAQTNKESLTISDESSIEALDPRDVGITANDGPEQNYEETALSVQRTLTAVNSQGEKQLIRMRIPVMYKSRTLRLEGDTKKKAVEILKRLQEKSQQLANMRKDLDADLIEWNSLVKAATPYDTLLPESPSLPQNQSAGSLNRENNPEMSAGKSISYEIVPTGKQN
jgi:hypothetical protein